MYDVSLTRDAPGAVAAYGYSGCMSNPGEREREIDTCCRRAGRLARLDGARLCCSPPFRASHAPRPAGFRSRRLRAALFGSGGGARGSVKRSDETHRKPPAREAPPALEARGRSPPGTASSNAGLSGHPPVFRSMEGAHQRCCASLLTPRLAQRPAHLGAWAQCLSERTAGSPLQSCISRPSLWSGSSDVQGWNSERDIDRHRYPVRQLGGVLLLRGPAHRHRRRHGGHGRSGKTGPSF